jgi:hypothetical protein
MWTVTSVFAVFFVCTAFLFQLVTLSNIRLPLCVPLFLHQTFCFV